MTAPLTLLVAALSAQHVRNKIAARNALNALNDTPADLDDALRWARITADREVLRWVGRIEDERGQDST